MKNAIIHILSKLVLFCLWALIKAVSTEERKKLGQRSHKPSDLNWALGRGPVFPSNTDNYFLRLAGGQILCQCYCPKLATSLTCLRGQRKGLPQANKTAETKLPLSFVKPFAGNAETCGLRSLQDDRGRMYGHILKTANPLDLHFAAADWDAKLVQDWWNFLDAVRYYMQLKNTFSGRLSPEFNQE